MTRVTNIDAVIHAAREPRTIELAERCPACGEYIDYVPDAIGRLTPRCARCKGRPPISRNHESLRGHPQAIQISMPSPVADSRGQCVGCGHALRSCGNCHRPIRAGELKRIGRITLCASCAVTWTARRAPRRRTHCDCGNLLPYFGSGRPPKECDTCDPVGAKSRAGRLDEYRRPPRRRAIEADLHLRRAHRADNALEDRPDHGTVVARRRNSRNAARWFGPSRNSRGPTRTSTFCASAKRTASPIGSVANTFS